MIEMVILAEEFGVIGGERTDSAPPLVRVAVQNSDIIGKGRNSPFAQIFGEARIDEHRLAFRHDNARLVIDQFRQRVKLVLVIDEVVRAIERVLAGSHGVHAASARRARPSPAATIVSTYSTRAPTPYPNNLATAP